MFASGLGMIPHSSNLRLERFSLFSPCHGVAINRSLTLEDQHLHLLQKMVSLLPCNAFIR